MEQLKGKKKKSWLKSIKGLLHLGHNVVAKDGGLLQRSPAAAKAEAGSSITSTDAEEQHDLVPTGHMLDALHHRPASTTFKCDPLNYSFSSNPDIDTGGRRRNLKVSFSLVLDQSPPQSTLSTQPLASGSLPAPALKRTNSSLTGAGSVQLTPLTPNAPESRSQSTTPSASPIKAGRAESGIRQGHHVPKRQLSQLSTAGPARGSSSIERSTAASGQTAISATHRLGNGTVASTKRLSQESGPQATAGAPPPPGPQQWVLEPLLDGCQEVQTLVAKCALQHSWVPEEGDLPVLSAHSLHTSLASLQSAVVVATLTPSNSNGNSMPEDEVNHASEKIATGTTPTPRTRSVTHSKGVGQLRRAATTTFRSFKPSLDSLDARNDMGRARRGSRGSKDLAGGDGMHGKHLVDVWNSGDTRLKPTLSGSKAAWPAPSPRPPTDSEISAHSAAAELFSLLAQSTRHLRARGSVRTASPARSVELVEEEKEVGQDLQLLHKLLAGRKVASTTPTGVERSSRSVTMMGVKRPWGRDGVGSGNGAGTHASMLQSPHTFMLHSGENEPTHLAADVSSAGKVSCESMRGLHEGNGRVGMAGHSSWHSPSNDTPTAATMLDGLPDPAKQHSRLPQHLPASHVAGMTKVHSVPNLQDGWSVWAPPAASTRGSPSGLCSPSPAIAAGDAEEGILWSRTGSGFNTYSRAGSQFLSSSLYTPHRRNSSSSMGQPPYMSRNSRGSFSYNGCVEGMLAGSSIDGGSTGGTATQLPTVLERDTHDPGTEDRLSWQAFKPEVKVPHLYLPQHSGFKPRKTDPGADGDLAARSRPRRTKSMSALLPADDSRGNSIELTEQCGLHPSPSCPSPYGGTNCLHPVFFNSSAASLLRCRNVETCSQVINALIGDNPSLLLLLEDLVISALEGRSSTLVQYLPFQQCVVRSSTEQQAAKRRSQERSSIDVQGQRSSLEQAGRSSVENAKELAGCVWLQVQFMVVSLCLSEDVCEPALFTYIRQVPGVSPLTAGPLVTPPRRSVEAALLRSADNAARKSDAQPVDDAAASKAVTSDADQSNLGHDSHAFSQLPRPRSARASSFQLQSAIKSDVFVAAGLSMQLQLLHSALAHVPCIVTIMAMDGRVLFQNGKSVEYCRLVMNQPSQPSWPLDHPQHTLRRLFATDLSSLTSMIEAVQQNQPWRGLVRMPAVMDLSLQYQKQLSEHFPAHLGTVSEERPTASALSAEAAVCTVQQCQQAAATHPVVPAPAPRRGQSNLGELLQAASMDMDVVSGLADTLVKQRASLGGRSNGTVSVTESGKPSASHAYITIGDALNNVREGKDLDLQDLDAIKFSRTETSTLADQLLWSSSLNELKLNQAAQQASTPQPRSLAAGERGTSRLSQPGETVRTSGSHTDKAQQLRNAPLSQSGGESLASQSGLFAPSALFAQSGLYSRAGSTLHSHSGLYSHTGSTLSQGLPASQSGYLTQPGHTRPSRMGSTLLSQPEMGMPSNPENVTPPSQSNSGLFFQPAHSNTLPSTSNSALFSQHNSGHLNQQSSRQFSQAGSNDAAGTSIASSQCSTPVPTGSCMRVPWVGSAATTRKPSLAGTETSQAASRNTSFAGSAMQANIAAQPPPSDLHIDRSTIGERLTVDTKGNNSSEHSVRDTFGNASHHSGEEQGGDVVMDLPVLAPRTATGQPPGNMVYTPGLFEMGPSVNRRSMPGAVHGVGHPVSGPFPDFFPPHRSSPGTACQMPGVGRMSLDARCFQLSNTDLQGQSVFEGARASRATVEGPTLVGDEDGRAPSGWARAGFTRPAPNNRGRMSMDVTSSYMFPNQEAGTGVMQRPFNLGRTSSWKRRTEPVHTSNALLQAESGLSGTARAMKLVFGARRESPSLDLDRTLITTTAGHVGGSPCKQEAGRASLDVRAHHRGYSIDGRAQSRSPSRFAHSNTGADLGNPGHLPVGSPPKWPAVDRHLDAEHSGTGSEDRGTPLVDTSLLAMFGDALSEAARMPQQPSTQCSLASGPVHRGSSVIAGVVNGSVHGSMGQGPHSPVRLDSSGCDEAGSIYGYQWHDVQAQCVPSPTGGPPLLLLIHFDVTHFVNAELEVKKVLDVEHRLLEEIFPRHVLEVMAAGEAPHASSSGKLPTLAYENPNMMTFSIHPDSVSVVLDGTKPAAGGDGGSPGGLHAKLTAMQRAATALGSSAGSLISTGTPNSGAYAMSTPVGSPPRPPSNGLLSPGPQAVLPSAAMARHHPMVTILFADIKSFTSMCNEVPPHVVMTFLNQLFTHFDELVEHHGVYKVETIGDCYMVAGGLLRKDVDGVNSVTTELDADHANKVLAFAQDMLAAAACVPMPTDARQSVQLRVGIHSGPCMSGVVGRKMPRFCLFGDTVNTASRCESTGQACCIHVSEETWMAFGPQQRGQPGWQATGGVEAKGKGKMQTYLWSPPGSVSAHCM